jgi:hypothetical protein
MLSGYQPPTISMLSVNITTVTFSIVMHNFSLPTVYYEIFLSRITGVSQELCTENMDEHRLRISAVKSSNMVSFSNLEELSAYHINVTAGYNFFNEETTRHTTLNFTTLGAGKISQLTL